MNVELGIESILRNCPNLEELSLRSAIVDLRLSFTGDQVNHYRSALGLNWKDATSVATELQDSHSPFSMCVRRLRLHLDAVRNTRGELDEDRINTILAKLLLVLEANQSLEHLDVIAPTQYHHEFFEKFRAHHLTPIRKTMPLSLKSKIAFLSIISCSRAQTGDERALEPEISCFALDQHFVRKIFKFAAPQFSVEFTSMRWFGGQV